jgi:trehalose synthase
MRPNISSINLRIAPVEQVKVECRSIAKFSEIFPKVQFEEYLEQINGLVHRINSNATEIPRFFHISSTSTGGGVAEILRFLVPYFNDIGLESHWLVIKGDEEFFSITKRIHNGLHGFSSKGSCMLYGAEHEHYKKISKENLEFILQKVRPGDICICHDPQTAGMIKGLGDAGIFCIWRCHIGNELSNNHEAVRAWDFLKEYVMHADRFAFSMKEFAPDWIPSTKLLVIQPSIDPFCPKNQHMEFSMCKKILFKAGLLDHPEITEISEMVVDRGEEDEGEIEDSKEDEDNLPASYLRLNGSLGIIKNPADSMHAGPLPSLNEPLIVQISRWDHLKDMSGVMRAFTEYILPEFPNSNLILAGPAVSSVSDDPEGFSVWNSTLMVWRQLPHFERARVQLVSLPMEDIEENAAIVNALQRCATIITQKSLYEGFGLTITEAMWKGKAVVASAVGGIKSQITNMEDGLMVRNPTDLETFAGLIMKLLKDDAFRIKIEKNAKATVIRNFLPLRHLLQYVNLYAELLDANKHSN